MTTVLLVIHLLIAIALVILVLLQPSEGGGLGIGGGGGGGGGGAGLQGFLTGRGTANALTRTTAALAASFMATSILLTIFAGGGQEADSILDQVPASEQPAVPENGSGLGTGTGSGSGAGSGDSGATGDGGSGGGGEQQPEVPVQ
jgi:preprotein translocase subunit SecG